MHLLCRNVLCAWHGFFTQMQNNNDNDTNVTYIAQIREKAANVLLRVRNVFSLFLKVVSDMLVDRRSCGR